LINSIEVQYSVYSVYDKLIMVPCTHHANGICPCFITVTYNTRKLK